MIHEFAVEPGCLAEWHIFIRLIEQFGVSEGRVISRFPKDWIRMVLERCSSFTFRQKEILGIEMQRIKRHALIRSGRVYDGSKGWVENALAQYEPDGRPFWAVIVKKAPCNADYLLIAEEILRDTPRWKVERDREIVRSITELGNALRILLQMSDQIMFVDRMFDPEEVRWRSVLEQFIFLATAGRERLPELEYHLEIKQADLGVPESQRRDRFQGKCDLHLSNVLPPSVKLSLKRWTRWHDQSDFFHGRYILTDKGGIRIDWGLDSGRQEEKTDVSLLDNDFCMNKIKYFRNESPVYQLIDTVTVEGKKIVP